MVGYKKEHIRKGGHWFSLRASTLSFPSNKFPFSCLIAQLALFFSASPYILVLEPGREDPLQLCGLLSQAHLWWSPPLDLANKLRWLWDRTLHCLAGLTSTRRSTFHPSVVTRVSEIPFSQILSLASFPSPSTRQPHGPRALSLVPHLILK